MDLRSPEAQSAKLEEHTVAAADIKKLENYGPKHNTFTAIYFTLTGLHALHILGGTFVICLLCGARRPDVAAGSRTIHQPHRSLRPVLAFCGLGLDFSVPCALFDLTDYE